LNVAGEMLGKLEPKIRQRLIRLIGMGNEYSAIVTAVDESALRIIIRESHRDPSMGSRPSFPTTGDAFRGYVRDSLLRYDIDEEEDEDDDLDEPSAEHEPDLVAEDVAVEDVRGAAPDDIEDDDDEE